MRRHPLLPFVFALLLAGPPLAATDGTPDPDFGTGGRRRVAFDLAAPNGDYGSAVAIDSRGRVVVSGTVDNGALGTDCGIARLLPDGVPDASFGNGGLLTWDLSPQLTYNDTCSDVAIGEDDSVFAAGTDGQGRIWVHRFPVATGAGLPELHDTPPQVALQPDGAILLGWSDGDFQVCRFVNGYNLDPSFGTAGCATVAFDLGGGLNDDLYDVAVQPDGRILLVGSAEWGSGDADFAVARLLADGTLDPAFGFGGTLAIAFDLNTAFPDIARSVALDETGWIYLAGGAGTGFLAWEAAVAQVASDGSFYSTAHFLPVSSSSASAASAVVQDDGKVVVAGSSRSAGEFDFWSMRLLPGLAADPSFGGAVEFDPVRGGDDWAMGVALQSGRAVLVGTAEWADPDYDFAVLRLEGSLIFADGFERGSTGHWSSAAP